MIVILIASNDSLAFLCNSYFFTCDWRFIWCHFVPDEKKHPSGGSQSQLNIDSCTLLFIIMLINWLQEFSYLALIIMLLQQQEFSNALGC